MGILRTDRVAGLGGANAISGSVYFPHDGSATTTSGVLQIQNANDALTFGTGDFTVEFWFYTNRIGVTQHLYDGRGTGAGSNTAVLIQISDSNNIRFFTTNAYRITGSSTLKANTWYHVALTRTGSTHTLYVDGSSDGTYSNSGMNYTGPTNGFSAIGSDDNGAGAYGLSGYISNLRIAKELIYSAAFTVPTTALIPTSNTTLLCCQSPGNVEASFGGLNVNAFAASTNSRGPEASRFTPNSPVGFSTTTDVGTQFGSTFDGVTTFDSQAYMVPPGGNARERNRGRGLHAGGENPTHCNIIDFIQIQSGGISEDFGDLITVSNSCDGVSSNTRAVFATYDAPTYNSLEFVTMATTGNATDFGDQTISTGQEGSLSNATRGLFAGGYGGAAQVFVNTVEFITIPTLGNAQDFGNLREAIVGVGGASDTTRGLFAGGVVPGAYRANIDQFTIATTGDATDFGDLSVARRNPAGTSDSTRGVFFGGNDSGGTNVIDFVTIQTAGNATDFGDSTSNQTNASGASDSIRGVFSAGYYGSPHLSNVIEKVIIQTRGNSVDYGDLIDERIQGGSVSDSHGGLS